jgi:hypothetical protein
MLTAHLENKLLYIDYVNMLDNCLHKMGAC